MIYDTEKATALARTDEGSFAFGRITLYRTTNLVYFRFTETPFLMGSNPEITPLELHKAFDEYNKLPLKMVDFKQAFPSMLFREA